MLARQTTVSEVGIKTTIAFEHDAHAREPEKPEPKEEEGAVDAVDADNDDTSTPRNPFTVPRYDPFTRNDDIEYDWGDSDEEL